MPNANVLVLIHGIVEDSAPSSHARQYQALWKALQAQEPILTRRIDAVIPVEWGHAPLPAIGSLLPDEGLTAAENSLLDAVSFARLKAHPGPEDSFLGFRLGSLLRALLRPLTRPIKETVITLGVTDSFYYCSADGERAVRDHVYSQVLTGLEPYKTADRVALHLIGHSQGATVGFDFLFGLLAPDSEYPPDGIPGFVQDQQSTPEMRQKYLDWRAAGRAGRLSLGSKSSFGAQIGIMMLRKQKLVDRLARNELLDPTVIGVPRTGDPRWKIFYDAGDVLGYPARRLFDATGTIREYEVDSSWNPVAAHIMYWTNRQVQAEIAALIRANLV